MELNEAYASTEWMEGDCAIFIIIIHVGILKGHSTESKAFSHIFSIALCQIRQGSYNPNEGREGRSTGGKVDWPNR